MNVRRYAVFFLALTGGLSLSAQGLHLFSDEVRQAATYHQRVVMDFMERYFGSELTGRLQTTLEHKMADDKVYFRKGNMQQLRQLADTVPFSIELLDRYYEVNWLKNDEPFVTVVFPAQYDLLLGLRKDEAVNRLKNVILDAPQRSVDTSIPDSLEQLDDSVWQSKTQFFELESLNDAIYYNKVEDGLLPVFDGAHLDYSAANLFHGLITDADYRMYVEQSVYGMTTINYSLSLSQWLNYCAQLGLKVYFGVEEQREDGVLAMVIAQCRELGFNHLLSVVIPDKFVTDDKAVLKVRLTPYIPTHNIKNLYQQETGNHKKKVWH